MVKPQGNNLRLNPHTVDITSSRACVSVIIPCYLCSETIGRALASVAAQTLLPKEVIIVEDASPDGGVTLKTLHEQVAKYADNFEVKVIALNKNQGVANARNVGWNAASHPFIALLDADDAWHPNKIDIQYKFMQENPQVMLCGHTCEVFEKGITGNVNFHKNMVKTISSQKVLFSNPFSTPSVMLKKGIPFRFDSAKRYAEDYFLWLQVALSQGKVHKIELSLAYLFKAKYGDSGLSSHMWQMEVGELNNYFLLFKTNKISAFLFFICSVYSLIKYIRRSLLRLYRQCAFIH